MKKGTNSPCGPGPTSDHRVEYRPVIAVQLPRLEEMGPPARPQSDARTRAHQPLSVLELVLNLPPASKAARPPAPRRVIGPRRPEARLQGHLFQARSLPTSPTTASANEPSQRVRSHQLRKRLGRRRYQDRQPPCSPPTRRPEPVPIAATPQLMETAPAGMQSRQLQPRSRHRTFRSNARHNRVLERCPLLESACG